MPDLTMTDDARVELRPCPNPWCENTHRGPDFRPSIEYSGLGNWQAKCPSCFIAGPLRSSKTHAEIAWNTRAIPSGVDLAAENAALREALETIEADCRTSITYYDHDGPAYTSPSTGIEYEHASYVQSKLWKLGKIATLARTHKTEKS